MSAHEFALAHIHAQLERSYAFVSFYRSREMSKGIQAQFDRYEEDIPKLRRSMSVLMADERTGVPELRQSGTYWESQLRVIPDEGDSPTTIRINRTKRDGYIARTNVLNLTNAQLAVLKATLLQIEGPK